MPAGHASHKGTSIKPNTNANDIIDTAADQSVEPEELLNEGGGYPFNAQGTVVNPAATERSSKQSEDS